MLIEPLVTCESAGDSLVFDREIVKNVVALLVEANSAQKVSFVS